MQATLPAWHRAPHARSCLASAPGRRRTLAAERRFNAAAGFSPIDDRLPDFFKKEKLAPHDVTFSVPDNELDKVFDDIE